LVVAYAAPLLRPLGKLAAHARIVENLLIRNRRDVGVTRRPRIDKAQATVPASCDEERIDELGAFLAEPVLARYQRQLAETLLQSINLHCYPLSIGISLLYGAGSESVFVALAIGQMMFD
jgi:hypothetical protein